MREMAESIHIILQVINDLVNVKPHYYLDTFLNLKARKKRSFRKSHDSA